MKQWIISYLDKDGVPQKLDHEAEQQPSEEQAAALLRELLVPVTQKLDLNDLEGRTDDPTVKALNDQNSVKLLSITEAS
jgi:hypothetical protein